MNKIDDVKKLIEEKLIGINSMEELNAIKSEFLGKKGFITELQGLIKEVENDKKKEFDVEAYMRHRMEVKLTRTQEFDLYEFSEESLAKELNTENKEAEHVKDSDT